MASNFKNIIKVWKDNTIIGVIVVCIVVIFGQAFFPDIIATKVLPYFIPIVVAVLFVEFMLFRNSTLETLEKIEGQVKNNYGYELFLDREEADEYTILRIKSAKKIRHIHFSSFSTLKDTKGNKRRMLYTSLAEFIKNPSSQYMRIVCDTNSQQVKEWIEADLREYKDYKFGISILKETSVENFRLLGLLIIDDLEIMFWGGSGPTPTTERIILHGSEVVDFFIRYFDQLNRYAIPVNLNEQGQVDWSKY